MTSQGIGNEMVRTTLFSLGLVVIINILDFSKLNLVSCGFFKKLINLNILFISVGDRASQTSFPSDSSTKDYHWVYPQFWTLLSRARVRIGYNQSLMWK